MPNPLLGERKGKQTTIRSRIGMNEVSRELLRVLLP
jgi:hypothetical protein